MEGMPAAAAGAEVIETRLGAVECARSGHGPAVLLLHGAMGGWDQAIMLGRLAIGGGEFEWVAPSRPGYLGTPLAIGRTAEQQADLYAALLDELGIGEAGVAAVSAGGPSALQFALRHPGRCRGLVLISACSSRLEVRPPLNFYLLLLLARFPSMVRRMSRRVESDPDSAARRAMPDPALRAMVLNDPEVAPMFRENQLDTVRRMHERLAGTRNDIAQTRKEFVYPVEQIAAPSLIVHGVEDRVVPFAQSQSLAARIPGAELLAIAGGAHISLFAHRRIIQPRVADFFRSQLVR